MSEAVKRGFKRLDFGFWQFDGVLLSGLHPTKITVTDTSITFDYAVGGQPVSRAYALTKADGKITSFTSPDGSVTEVVRDG
nr:MAG TPA: hypothetical protein [Bacteriophage sp.]